MAWGDGVQINAERNVHEAGENAYNRVELRASINAHELLPEDAEVDVITDSNLRLNSITNSVCFGTAMTSAEMLSSVLRTVEVNEAFTEAVLHLCDNSRLCFCHRVDERWAKAVGPEEREQEGQDAEALLSAIKRFRLNRKHLDIEFADGSRWDEALQDFDRHNG